MGHDLSRTKVYSSDKIHIIKMKLVALAVVLTLLLHSNYAVPVKSNFNLLENDETAAAFDALVEQVTNDFIEDVKLNVQYDARQDFQDFLEEVQKVVKGVNERVGPKAIQIVKDYRGRIVANLIFKDFEGLKNTVRQMAKKIIVVVDDELIKLITGDGYDQEEWNQIMEAWKKATDLWHNDEEFKKGLQQIINWIEEKIMKDIKSYLIDLVSAITDWAVGLLDKASKVQIGYNEYITVPDIKKLLESIEAMGTKLINSLEAVLGDVLQDRPFVVKEVRRYQEALKILVKKVAVEIKVTIERILKAFADLINRLG